MTPTIRWLAVLAAVLVLIQAVLIGQGLYPSLDQGMVGLHGTLGSVSLLAVIALTVLAVLSARRGEGSSIVTGLSVITLILVVAQLGLGYVGRRNGVAASIHIPNGVLIAGLLFAIAATTFSTALGNGARPRS